MNWNLTLGATVLALAFGWVLVSCADSARGRDDGSIIVPGDGGEDLDGGMPDGHPDGSDPDGGFPGDGDPDGGSHDNRRPQCAAVHEDTGRSEVQVEAGEHRLDATGSSDPEGSTLTFSWSCPDLPPGVGEDVLLNPSWATPTLRATAPGSYRCCVVATDEDGASCEPACVVVEVTPPDTGARLQVSLSWEIDGDDNIDLDLHLVRGFGSLWTSEDCYHQNCRRGAGGEYPVRETDWGRSCSTCPELPEQGDTHGWEHFEDQVVDDECGDVDADDPAGPRVSECHEACRGDDPVMLVDNTSGSAPELIEIECPRDEVYRAIVHIFSRRVPEPPNAWVTVVMDGGAPVTFSLEDCPQPSFDSYGDSWQAVIIDWPERSAELSCSFEESLTPPRDQ